MKIKVGDKIYEHDEMRLLVSELAFIQKKTGLQFKDWNQGLADLDAMSLKALVYIVQKREGEQPDWETLDFDVLEIFDVEDDEDEDEVVQLPKEDGLSVAS